MLLGWQARHLDDPETDRPKYLTARGTLKNRLLYGWPKLRETSGPILIVEGVTDMWRAGPGAVALLGKTISRDQVTLLVHPFQDRPVVVMLDNDAEEAAQKVVTAIRSGRGVFGAGQPPVVLAAVPGHKKDPGEADRDAIWRSVTHALKRDRSRS